MLDAKQNCLIVIISSNLRLKNILSLIAHPGGHFKIAGIAMGVCLFLLLDIIGVVTSNSSKRTWEASG